MAKRKTYTKEFKLEALRQWQNSGKSAAEVEEELDLSKGLLYSWRRQFGDEIDQVVPDNDQVVPEEEPETVKPEPDIEPKDKATEPNETKVEENIAPVIALSIAEEEIGPSEDESVTIDAETTMQGAPTPAAAESKQPEPEEKSDDAKPETAVEAPNRGKILVKRFAGLLGIILGTVGLILCLAFIAGVWAFNKPVTEGTLQFLARINQGLTVADEGLDQAEMALETVRGRLSEATAAFPAAEILRLVEDAQSIVNAAQSTADTANSVVGFANAIPIIGPSSSQPSSSTPALDEASATLDEISAGLGAVAKALDQRVEGEGLGALGAQIDAELLQLQGLMQNVNRSVEDANSTIVQLQEDLPGWIDVASILLTLLLLWLGLAQFSLLAHGWQWFRG